MGIDLAGVVAPLDRSQKLDAVLLYVLVCSDLCRAGLERTVHEALDGGAQLIQLREKRLDDRQLLSLARQLRRWTSQADRLFIMNDRADIAHLAGADGVHLGQEDLPVADARRIVGDRALVGVSTHSMAQAKKAVQDGADYIGVGPTFRSQTKAFDQFAGLELVRRVRREIGIPCFPIGGIDLENLDDLIGAGASRAAVCGAICASADPRGVAREFRRRLEASR